MLLSLPMEMTWGHMEEISFLCSSFSWVTGLFSQCTDSLAFALKTSVTTSFKILQIWAAIFEVGPLTLRSILGKSLGYQPITSVASTHHPKMHLFSSYSPLRTQLNTSLMPFPGWTMFSTFSLAACIQNQAYDWLNYLLSLIPYTFFSSCYFIILFLLNRERL